MSKPEWNTRVNELVILQYNRDVDNGPNINKF